MRGHRPCAGGADGVESELPIGRQGIDNSARPAHSTFEEVIRMSVLKLQNMEARTTQSAAATVSLTSSSSDCCKSPHQPHDPN
ncbi:class III lanthipeptide [Streptomyces avidinii]